MGERLAPEHEKDVSIRVASPDDLGELRDVYRRASLANEGDRANLLAHPEYLVLSDRAVREGRTRAALAGGRVVGFATLFGPELEDLFVDPVFQRRGIARALINGLVDEARAQGLSRIEVSANPHALSFYEKLGFVRDGVVETEFGPGSRMHLDLVGTPLT